MIKNSLKILKQKAAALCAYSVEVITQGKVVDSRDLVVVYYWVLNRGT